MPRRQPVVQVAGDLISDDDPAVAAVRARDVVVGWLREKQRLKLPPQADSGQSFDLDASEGQPLAVARFRNFWAMRLDRLDGEVAGRIWRTEVSIGHNASAAVVGVRLAVIDTAKTIRIPTSIPRVVCDLIETPGIVEYGVRLVMSAVDVSSQHDVDELISLLFNRARTRPVLVISANAGATEEANEIASRLAGIAHVYCIHERAVEALASAIGHEFGIPTRGLRTFNPGFNPQIDESSDHPPATWEWISSRFGSLNNFVWMLLDRFARRTVAGAADAGMPSVDQVKALEVEARLFELAKQGKPSERETLLEQRIALLEKSINEKGQEYDYAAQCVSDAEEERDRFRSQLVASQQRVVALEQKLGEAGTQVSIPESFEHLADWALEHFPGRLVMLSRALRAAKKSVYEDKALVYRCLAKLGRDYVDARRSGQPVEGIFESLGVQLERTGSRAHLSQWEEEYFFIHRQQSEFLEWHIKKGTGKNDTTTLRIYFFYDEEDGVAIVGHLTSHLTNDMT